MSRNIIIVLLHHRHRLLDLINLHFTNPPYSVWDEVRLFCASFTVNTEACCGYIGKDNYQKTQQSYVLLTILVSSRFV
jgi:hypothetical protein